MQVNILRKQTYPLKRGQNKSRFSGDMWILRRVVHYMASMNSRGSLLLMEDILHQLIRSLYHYLQGFSTIPGGWPWDFFHQQYEVTLHLLWNLRRRGHSLLPLAQKQLAGARATWTCAHIGKLSADHGRLSKGKVRSRDQLGRLVGWFI